MQSITLASQKEHLVVLSPKFRVVTLLLSDGVSEVIPVEKSLQKQKQSVFPGAIKVSGRNCQPTIVFDQANCSMLIST